MSYPQFLKFFLRIAIFSLFILKTTWAAAPATIDLPIDLGTNTYCVSIKSQCQMGWSFWQHQSLGHKQNGGISLANDTYAWDINLGPPKSDLDAGRPVYAVESGTIYTKGGWGLSKTDYGQLLIQHGSGDQAWSSGYLHMTKITSKKATCINTSNCTVSKGEIIGYIGGVGANNNHLHFVVYNSHGKTSSMQSSDVNFSGISAKSVSLTVNKFTLPTTVYQSQNLPINLEIYNNAIVNQKISNVAISWHKNDSIRTYVSDIVSPLANVVVNASSTWNPGIINSLVRLSSGTYKVLLKIDRTGSGTWETLAERTVSIGASLSANLSPSLTTISPSKILASDTYQLITLKGNNFQPNSLVYWAFKDYTNYVPPSRTTYIDSSTVQISIRTLKDNIGKWSFYIQSPDKKSSNVVSVTATSTSEQACSANLVTGLTYHIPENEVNFVDISPSLIQSFLGSKGSILATLDLNKYSLNPNIAASGGKSFSEVVSNWNERVLTDKNKTRKMSAAEIIYYASKENNMNPVLMLAFLQKEQSLISTSSVLNLQSKLNRAAGYMMKDTGDDPKYYSFLAQTTGLSWELRKALSSANGTFDSFLKSYSTDANSSRNLYAFYSEYRGYFKQLGVSPCSTNTLDAPVLISPLNITNAAYTSLQFKWNKSIDAQEYRVVVSTRENFDNFDENSRTCIALFPDCFTMNTGSLTSALFTDLKSNTTYYWKVRAAKPNATSQWSVGSFTTQTTKANNAPQISGLTTNKTLEVYSLIQGSFSAVDPDGDRFKFVKVSFLNDKGETLCEPALTIPTSGAGKISFKGCASYTQKAGVYKLLIEVADLRDKRSQVTLSITVNDLPPITAKISAASEVVEGKKWSMGLEVDQDITGAEVIFLTGRRITLQSSGDSKHWFAEDSFGALGSYDYYINATRKGHTEKVPNTERTLTVVSNVLGTREITVTSALSINQLSPYTLQVTTDKPTEVLQFTHPNYQGGQPIAMNPMGIEYTLPSGNIGWTVFQIGLVGTLFKDPGDFIFHLAALERGQVYGEKDFKINVIKVENNIDIGDLPEQLPQYENLKIKITTTLPMARAVIQFDGEQEINLVGSNDTVFTLNKPMLVAGHYQYSLKVYNLNGIADYSQVHSIKIMPPGQAALTTNLPQEIKLGQELFIQVNSSIPVRRVYVKFAFAYGTSMPQAIDTSYLSFKMAWAKVFSLPGIYNYVIEADDGRGNIQGTLIGSIKVVDPEQLSPSILSVRINGQVVNGSFSLNASDMFDLQVSAQGISGMILDLGQGFGSTSLRYLNNDIKLWGITYQAPAFRSGQAGITIFAKIYALDSGGQKIDSTERAFTLLIN